MRYGDRKADRLRAEVASRISAKRYSHTLEVEKTALLIGEMIGYPEPDKLSAAAILHDIAKEIPVEEQISMLLRGGFALTEEDISSPEILHSFAGALVFFELGEEYYDDEIADAISAHTVGSPDMSVLSMIIFISDYIEETRSYPACIEMRRRALDMLSSRNGNAESVLARICTEIIENTRENLVSRGKNVNSRMTDTEKSLKKKYLQN
ncbi:MAG: HD domain-containing protein [Ruminococcaceae bacterium]|nr:HD domain-containing protein [Oscillospiraceae bacterium]